MALVVEDGSGLSTAESYISVADAVNRQPWDDAVPVHPDPRWTAS